MKKEITAILLFGAVIMSGCNKQQYLQEQAKKKAVYKQNYPMMQTVKPQETTRIKETTKITTAKPIVTTKVTTEKTAVQTTAPMPTVTTVAIPLVTEPVTEMPVTEETTEESTALQEATKKTEEPTLPETEAMAEHPIEQSPKAEEQPEEEPTEPETRTFTYDDEFYYFPDYTLSRADYILLCNCVAHEAGNQPLYEMGKVVETVMNRVYNGAFPDTIYDVITQKNQFTGSYKYADLDGFSHEVNSRCGEAVENYFCFPEDYQHGYLFFYGDSYANYFL